MPLPVLLLEKEPSVPIAEERGGLVDHKAGLDNMETFEFFTLPALELGPLSRPARSQTLLRYRDATYKNKTNKQTPWSESASELYRPSGSDCQLLWIDGATWSA
jgi:hypothetical protein